MSFQDIISYKLFSIAGTPVTVATLAVSLIIAFLAFFAARVSEKAATQFLGKRGLKDVGSASASARLIYYIVLAMGITVALSTLGIDLTALFTAGAFFAIALGFAMRNITENFVSGLILLAERTIKPGDIVEVEGRLVKVTKMGMRATVVRTWDCEDYIIPNSNLVTTPVKNLTLRDRVYRIRTVVGVSYDSDMRRVREVLEEATRSLEGFSEFRGSA